MKKQMILLLVAVLVLFVAGYLLSPQFQPDSSVKPVQTEEDSVGFTYNKETPSAVMSAELEPSTVPALDKLVKDSVVLVLDQFEQDTHKVYLDDPSLFEPYSEEQGTRKWTQSFEGGIVSTVGDYVNYKVSGYEYTGGAHGNPSIVTYVWDTAEEGLNPILLDSLFSSPNDSVWLKKLSEESRKELLASRLVDSQTGGQVFSSLEFSLDDISSGTNPDKFNFSNFMVEEKGLRIQFGAYQVGPYSYGEPEILIPWENLSGYINPDIVRKLQTK